MVDSYDGVYKIVKEKDNKNNEELNDEVIKLLLDKKVITKESLSKLIDRNKIHIKDESILD